jgi:hypothetical protein
VKWNDHQFKLFNVGGLTLVTMFRFDIDIHVYVAFFAILLHIVSFACHRKSIDLAIG